MSLSPLSGDPIPNPSCDARIRPFPNDIEICCQCQEDADDHTQHHGVLRDYAYPGSATTISWAETDRRNFRGEWIECPLRGCVLPAGHRGEHSP